MTLLILFMIMLALGIGGGMWIMYGWMTVID